MSTPDNEFPGLGCEKTKPVKAKAEVFRCLSEAPKFLDVAVEELHVNSSRFPSAMMTA
jgi:hypothetical protein